MVFTIRLTASWPSAAMPGVMTALHALTKFGRIKHDLFDHGKHLRFEQLRLDLWIVAPLDPRGLGVKPPLKAPVALVRSDMDDEVRSVLLRRRARGYYKLPWYPGW
jgi:hypothetical protein